MQNLAKQATAKMFEGKIRFIISFCSSKHKPPQLQIRPSTVASPVATPTNAVTKYYCTVEYS